MEPRDIEISSKAPETSSKLPRWVTELPSLVIEGKPIVQQGLEMLFDGLGDVYGRGNNNTVYIGTFESTEDSPEGTPSLHIERPRERVEGSDYVDVYKGQREEGAGLRIQYDTANKGYNAFEISNGNLTDRRISDDTVNKLVDSYFFELEQTQGLPIFRP